MAPPGRLSEPSRSFVRPGRGGIFQGYGNHMVNAEGVRISADSIPKAGDCLRLLRNRLGLTTRKVAEVSREVPAKQGNSEYAISHARRVQIEKQASIPSVYKLFSLSSIYGVTLDELMATY